MLVRISSFQFPDVVAFLFILIKSLFFLWKALLFISNLLHRRGQETTIMKMTQAKFPKGGKQGEMECWELIFISLNSGVDGLFTFCEVSGIAGTWARPPSRGHSEDPAEKSLPRKEGACLLGITPPCKQHRGQPIANRRARLGNPPQFSDSKAGIWAQCL